MPGMGSGSVAGVAFYRDPDLPDFEIKICDDKTLSYKKHFHEEYSIGVVQKGSSKVWCDGEDLLTEEGQFISIPPYLPHSCNPEENSEWRYQMLFIRPAWIMKAGEPGKVLQEPFLLGSKASLRLKGLLNHMIQCYTRRLGPLETETAALDMLQTIRKGSAPIREITGWGEEEGTRLQRVRDYLEEHARDKVTLEELERLSGLSRFHLVHSFKRAYRVPPHAYQNLVRINAAKKELMKRRPIAEVALETGFYDQSHFTKCFKECVGVTPQKYLQSL